MTAVRSVRSVTARIDDVGQVPAVSILRVLLGPITWLHLRPFLEMLGNGTVWSDRFHEPWFDWYPEPGRTLSAVLLWTAVASAGAMALGLLSRASALVTCVIVTHNLFLSTTHYQHNRAFLVILLATVTILPTGRHLSIDAVIRRRLSNGIGEHRSTPLWPLYLVRFEVVVVYLASATSKLVDADWWGGRVLQLRAIYERQIALDAGAPAWILDLLADGTFQWWFSKGAVLTEFVIGFGLLARRTRVTAICVAIPFHLAIQIGASVQVFSWAALAALWIWVTPTAVTTPSADRSPLAGATPEGDGVAPAKRGPVLSP